MKTRPELTLEDCKKMSAAAEGEARRHDWIVAIAILDDGGHLLHLVRMDGATPANAAIAVEKARTAATTRRPSKMWEERVAGGRMSMLKMPVLPVQGGLPIMAQGSCVGGIGASGVQSHEDEQIVQAGIDALLKG
jgi:glc operon protein GlcG